MKKLLWVCFALLLLAGCAGDSSGMERALEIRSSLLKAEQVAFHVQITADYTERAYQFEMDCASDEEGNLRFTVTSPEGIAGVCGVISAGSGQLTFEGMRLDFGLMAENRISPISGPWLCLNSLRGGYIVSCGDMGDSFHMVIDESYEEDTLTTEVWTDSDGAVSTAEISWKGMRVLTLAFSDFKTE